MKKVIKRDNQVAEFDPQKITQAIWKAAESVGGEDTHASDEIANRVIELLDVLFKGENYPTVEQIQDLVEKILIESGHAKTAKAYILYRQKRKELREKQKKIIGTTTNLNLSLNALTTLAKRYLEKDHKGKVIEKPEQMFRRIAKNIAEADLNYDGENLERTEEKFYEMISRLDFLPNSPTLMNAGTDIQQLSACFVLPVEDSMEGIFTTLKNAALIHKSGGGTGFSFSRLRPKNDLVKSTTGISSGPVSFMKVFDAATEAIKQGGRRRGANMGILRIDHPDVLDFITMKSDMVTLTNFNISVAFTDKFMQALESDTDYELLNPRSGEPIKTLPARHVFDLILDMAWKNGDPGLIFIDTINSKNPVKHIGLIESTNPCGEQPLLPYESCNLGSINLNNFIDAETRQVNWERLREIIHTAVHFLDNVIDMNNYPIPEIAEMSKGTRKIGLGVMGFGDLLYQLKIPYNSEEGLQMGERIMKFINDEARNKSVDLARTRGTFPYYEGSDHEKNGMRMRNACVTTVAPTGSIGMIAEASGGIEPNFAISFIKYVMDDTELVYVNKYFEQEAKKRGFHSDDLMREIATVGSIQEIDEIPEDIKRIFVTAQDIQPEWHIRMQAAFQRHTDSAISKTINFPNSSTTREIEKAYKMAYQLGCKGITVYRDGSRDCQVLNIGEVKGKKEETHNNNRQHQEIIKKSKAQISGEGLCPECEGKLVMTEGCMSCPMCSFSACSVA